MHGRSETIPAQVEEKGDGLAEDTLTITDNRTGREYTLPITDGTIHATDLRQVSAEEGDGGLMSYDPAYLNTASCRSAITFIDGDRGILRYRGYPIEQLAEEASFLETAYLLLEGELPTNEQLGRFEDDVRRHVRAHERPEVPRGLPLRRAPDGNAARRDRRALDVLSRREAHRGRGEPLPAAYPAAREDADDRGVRLPALSRPAVRPAAERPRLHPQLRQHDLRDRWPPRAEPGPEHALEILLVLHADHEQNCSTSAVRSVGSSQVDPFSAVSAGIAALYGPLHGGANEAVLRMLDEIGDTKRVPEFIEEVKAGKGRLMGFGHRVYKSYDPRAKLIKRVADDVFEQTGLNPKLEVALELERIALEDEYFVSRKLYPNVDFYSGLIYQAMGYPTDYFTVLFALGRLPGWIAQWEEHLSDPEQKISRPRQVYTGAAERPYVPIAQRG